MKPVEAWQTKKLTEKLSNIDRKRLTMDRDNFLERRNDPNGTFSSRTCN